MKRETFRKGIELASLHLKLARPLPREQAPEGFLTSLWDGAVVKEASHFYLTGDSLFTVMQNFILCGVAVDPLFVRLDVTICNRQRIIDMGDCPDDFRQINLAPTVLLGSDPFSVYVSSKEVVREFTLKFYGWELTSEVVARLGLTPGIMFPVGKKVWDAVDAMPEPAAAAAPVRPTT